MRRLTLLVSLTLALVVVGSTAPSARWSTTDLPARLTDREFWQLSEELSEPGGVFPSDNMTSNELVFARMVPALIAQTKPGGVYLGVGPEQNFTYIAAMKPRMAFITDIRRGNLHLHLMYKALFELSVDRAEFVSRLFTKPRPDGLNAATSSLDLMNAYWDVSTADETVYDRNLDAIRQQLTKTRRIPLPETDLEGIAAVYRTFYWYGLRISYSARTTLATPVPAAGTNYWALMTQTDAAGEGLSYLGSEEKFRVLKDLHSRNMLVPVVGNFAGPKALRAVGAYVKNRGATVSAFYLSNVESYLRRDQSWSTFCSNVATFPLDDASVFIRPSGSGRGTFSLVVPPGATAATNASGRPTLQFIQILPIVGSAAASSTEPVLQAGLVPIAAEVKACGSPVSSANVHR